MILAVNADRAVGPRTGVGRNLEYLLHGWAGKNGPFDRVRVVSPAPVEDLPDDPRFEPYVAPSRGPGIWWQTTHLRRAAADADVLFDYYTIPPAPKARTVVANLGIYEGQHAVSGIRARLHSYHYAYSARTADAVIVNAPSTGADLVEFYRVDPDKLTVIWPGADTRFRPMGPDDEEPVGRAVERTLGDTSPYFLFVGKLSERRHVPEILEAFKSLRSNHPSHRLVLVGPSPPQLALDARAEELGLTGTVHHVSHLDQDTLALLYRGARAFLMPTDRDGFSHPILEAMGSACPVIALEGAVVGALEFVDENVPGGSRSAVLFAEEPTPAALAAAMERVAADDELRARLSAGGVRCAKAFPSWDDHARETMELLGRVASA